MGLAVVADKPDTGADAGAVRSEDAFDSAALAAWLREQVAEGSGRWGDDGIAASSAGWLGAGALDAVPEVRQFVGGASNLTYLLRYPTVDLILRRPPMGAKAKSAHDMGREFRIQSRLRPVFPYVPRMVALCQDASVIGSDFYVMERLEGRILRRDIPAQLGGPGEVRALCMEMLDVLVELHSIDPASAGLEDIGKGEGYVARQVAGWCDRYRKARTWNVGSYASVMAWLEDNQPDDVRTCVIHNDFRFDNVVLGPRPSGEEGGGSEGGSQRGSHSGPHVRGVLDWEMATLGDPLMDLGGALAYWVQADDDPIFRRFRRQPTHAPGMLTRAEVVEHYTHRMGLTLTPGQWAFYEVFGLFRLAVIAQQIYFRYFHQQTTNPSYKQFHYVVLYLDYRCRRLIRRSGR